MAENVSVKYMETVNGIFQDMKDEGRRVGGEEEAVRAEVKMKMKSEPGGDDSRRLRRRSVFGAGWRVFLDAVRQAAA